MKTVLIVDDNDKHRDFIRRSLEVDGYLIVEASNGVDALRILYDPENEVDVVTLDWSMPEMDGKQFLDHIRSDNKIKNIRIKHKKDPHLPVIMITVFVSDQEVKKMRKEADDYIPKPLSYKDIQKAVKKLLNKAGD